MMQKQSLPLEFSKQPGPHERQLLRKWNNPLFKSTEALTQQSIQQAQQKDQRAMQQFMEVFRELVTKAVKLDVTVESDVVMMLKAQLEQQYAICTGLAGPTTAIQDAIKKLIGAISSTLRATASNDPHALEKLDKDEEHTHLHLHLCEYLIVSDILNPDEIISDDEIVPTLLNEKEDALQAALALFPPERIQMLVAEGNVLMNKIDTGRTRLPSAWQSLAQIEIWSQGKTT